jgi:hypothetical protein
MPSLLPVFSRGNTGDAIASYDWLDITSGCGYRTYYPAVTSQDSTSYYILTTKSELSSATGVFRTSGDFNYDFDITNKVPCVIGGGDVFWNSYFTVGNSTYTLTVNFCHVSAAAVETVLGTASITRSSGGGANYKDLFRITLATNTKFAIGDKIRVNVVVTNSQANSKTEFDPANNLTATDTDGRTIVRNAEIHVPFKIDI